MLIPMIIIFIKIVPMNSKLSLQQYAYKMKMFTTNITYKVIPSKLVENILQIKDIIS